METNDMLSLTWNNHGAALIHNLNNFLFKECYCDATIICENKHVKVHKLILSTCSEYFQEIFENVLCMHPFIILNGISLLEFEALLEYMYKGRANIFKSRLPYLLKAADSLRIKGLAVSDDHVTSPIKISSKIHSSCSVLPNENSSSPSTTSALEENYEYLKRNVAKKRKGMILNEMEAESSSVMANMKNTAINSTEKISREKQISNSQKAKVITASEQMSNSQKAKVIAANEQMSNSQKAKVIAINKQMSNSPKTKVIALTEQISNSPKTKVIALNETSNNVLLNSKSDLVVVLDRNLSMKEANSYNNIERHANNILSDAVQPIFVDKNATPSSTNNQSIISAADKSETKDSSQVKPSLEKGSNIPKHKFLKALNTGNLGSNIEVLKIHSDSEKDSYPHKCSSCSFHAKYPSSLKKHMQSHSEFKPFKCGMCNYRTNNKIFLVKHIKSHNAEKLYKCSKCPFSASLKISLNKHIEKFCKGTLKDKHFVCSTCTFETKEETVFEAHLNSHVEKKHFICAFCPHKTSRKSLLASHVASAHKDIENSTLEH